MRPPGFVEPQHPTAWPKPPNGDSWLSEIKFDGYRAQIHVFDAKPIIYTRRGNDWTGRFDQVASALRSLKHDAIFDGELVALDEKGFPDFHALQLAAREAQAERVVYFAFDLLYLDGYDVRDLPLIERRELLRALVTELGNDRVRLSETFDASGAEVFESVKRMGLEGMVSKRKDSRYRSGRQQSWIKAKVIQSETFVVVGFTTDEPRHSHYVKSLYLGRFDGDRLIYSGKAETGFSDAAAATLFKLLSTIARKSSPLSEDVRKPKAKWVEPKVQVEIEFTGMTSDGHLRHPSFKGIREDLR
jgi:bifunctional non-homologous end joining protein LigD